MSKVMQWAHEHWLVFSIIAIWLMSLVTFIVVVGMLIPPDMNGSVASVLVAVLNIPALIVGLYKFRKGKEKSE